MNFDLGGTTPFSLGLSLNVVSDQIPSVALRPWRVDLICRASNRVSVCVCVCVCVCVRDRERDL